MKNGEQTYREREREKDTERRSGREWDKGSGKQVAGVLIDLAWQLLYLWIWKCGGEEDRKPAQPSTAARKSLSLCIAGGTHPGLDSPSQAIHYADAPYAAVDGLQSKLQAKTDWAAAERREEEVCMTDHPNTIYKLSMHLSSLLSSVSLSASCRQIQRNTEYSCWELAKRRKKQYYLSKPLLSRNGPSDHSVHKKNSAMGYADVMRICTVQGIKGCWCALTDFDAVVGSSFLKPVVMRTNSRRSREKLINEDNAIASLSNVDAHAHHTARNPIMRRMALHHVLPNSRMAALSFHADWRILTWDTPSRSTKYITQRKKDQKDTHCK